MSRVKQRLEIKVFGNRLLGLEKFPKSLSDTKGLALSVYRSFKNDPNTRCTLVLLLNILLFDVFYGCLFLRSIVEACKYRRAMNMSKMTSSNVRLQQPPSQYTTNIRSINRANIQQNLQNFRKQDEKELIDELDDPDEVIYEEKF
uniref:Uncharacterized protein n=1 Tax=Syphacia muris TaxID=451379 RepID=A0A0N5AEY7_9BILA